MRRDAADFEQGRHNVNHMTELIANAAKILDVAGPRDRHALPDAAKVRRDLFGPGGRERSKSRCLLGRELLITLAPQNDKCVVVTVHGPRTRRDFAKLDELPVTRIFDAKTQVIANRRRHI
jgi:hypothetical protein